MEYRVLARKYRPSNFDDLIGQDVLVRTLSNAIKSNRIAHAFLLTGIRGIGKTTTARIIARALNCIGTDGQGGATISPCGVCSNCMMIAQDRHVDVLEMDAASHTGVGDIRELIDSVRYLPSSARYKIYIIDEVHMLSNNAFNALLKTLEEPPPHVKFIFATTESRKIPVTILSRCQRFDLKRITMELLVSHLANIAQKEQMEIEQEALKLIALAAEGSVRDALSLLDQAIARGAEEGASINAAVIRYMIGSADKTATFRLLELLLKGEIAPALEQVQTLYGNGADPLLIVQECLETVHVVTRVKVSPAALEDVSLSEHDRRQAKAMADKLSMGVLARLWQMLLKGVGEVRLAPTPLAALEMLLVRVAYGAQLPTPAEALRGGASEPAASLRLAMPLAAPEPARPVLALVSDKPAVVVPDFAAAVALFETHREPLLYSQLKQDARLVAFAPGHIELKLSSSLPRDFCVRVADCLSRWTGTAWKITRSEQDGNPSLHEQEILLKKRQVEEASAHPLVASVLDQFPGAMLVGVSANNQGVA